MKRIYQTPRLKVVKVKAHQMLCASKGSFGLSSNEVTAGDASDLSDEDLGW